MNTHTDTLKKEHRDTQDRATHIEQNWPPTLLSEKNLFEYPGSAQGPKPLDLGGAEVYKAQVGENIITFRSQKEVDKIEPIFQFIPWIVGAKAFYQHPPLKMTGSPGQTRPLM